MNELAEALKECGRTTKETHAVVHDALIACKDSLKDEKRELEKVLAALKERRLERAALYSQVRKAAQELLRELESLEDQQIGRNKALRDRKSAFSITLFGRTMAGKSTLMEILTKGDGASIGHGEQRCTRDSRSYEWNGIEILDVPGVAAFGGADDEEIAMNAAVRADLVLFLINDDAPQPVEGLHLARVRGLGLPVIGVCNVKEGITDEDLADERRLARAVRKIEEKFEPARLAELTGQLMKFAREHAPGIEVDFTACHLRSRFLGQRTSVATLVEASRVHHVESRIELIVRQQGPFLRTRSFLGGTCAYLNQITAHLFAAASETNQAKRTLHAKVAGLRRWVPRYLEEQRGAIDSGLADIYGALRAQVPGFVAKHVEDRAIQDRWKEVVEGAKIERRVAELRDRIVGPWTEMQAEVARELEVELADIGQGSEVALSHAKITDWKRIYQWGTTILGGLAEVALLVCSLAIPGFAAIALPAGIAVGVAVTLLGLLAGLFDGRAEKRERAESQLRDRLLGELDVQEAELQASLKTWLVETLANKAIDEFERDLVAAADALEALEKLQLQLAKGICAQAALVGRRLVEHAMVLCGAAAFVDSVQSVAHTAHCTLLVLKPMKKLPPTLVNELARALQTEVLVAEHTGEDTSLALQFLGGFCLPGQIRDVDGVIEVRPRDNHKMFQDRISLVQQLASRPVLVVT